MHEFTTARQFDAWLRKNAARETEIWIRIFKVKSGVASITTAEAIDVALTWGWIDAIRRGHDEESFLQRYTPRGKRSIWSQVNVANVERLVREGRMKPAGLAQVEAAKADGRWAKAYRQKTAEPPPDLLAALRAEPEALAMFGRLSAQNRFAVIFRVGSLKTEAARKRKIATFVEMLRKGETIHPQK